MLNVPDSDIRYYPRFFTAEKAANYFRIIEEYTPWQQDTITVFGKTHLQPQLTALYANNEKSYTYANITMQPHAFTPELLAIKAAVEKEVEIVFSSCLLNYYRDGKDSNGWHADDEKALGPRPVIASVSFGTERFFHLRHKRNKALKHKIRLQQGSLLVMQGETQTYWQHQIAKTARKIGGRINLTFRVIY